MVEHQVKAAELASIANPGKSARFVNRKQRTANRRLHRS
ncbi:unnamed protein product [Chrysoparadoxa australica]